MRKRLQIWQERGQLIVGKNVLNFQSYIRAELTSEKPGG